MTHEGFTPGPWVATNDYAPGILTPWDVISPGPCITVATDLTEANAKLIADAPRLLAENAEQAKEIAELREREAKLVELLSVAVRWIDDACRGELPPTTAEFVAECRAALSLIPKET